MLEHPIGRRTRNQQAATSICHRTATGVATSVLGQAPEMPEVGLQVLKSESVPLIGPNAPFVFDARSPVCSFLFPSKARSPQQRPLHMGSWDQ